MPEFAEPRDVVHPLDEKECWEFLGRHEFGRLAYTLVGDVQIVPINYVSDHEAVYFRTAEGSKLLGVTMNDAVAFEVDDLVAAPDGRRDAEACSVVVHGKAEVLEGQDKARAEQLPLRPWVPTQKHTIVRIAVSEISGHRFDLSKPWEHMSTRG